MVENGISNPAFEPDGNGMALEAPGALETPEAPAPAPRRRDLLTAKNQSSPNLVPSPTFAKKKKLLKSCSVPDFDKRIKKREKNLM